eukprot:17670-Heterococcus_DN1.PRE.3
MVNVGVLGSRQGLGLGHIVRVGQGECYMKARATGAIKGQVKTTRASGVWRASASAGQHIEGGCSRQDCDSSNCRTRTSTTLYGQSKRANAHEDEAAQWRRQGNALPRESAALCSALCTAAVFELTSLPA